MSMILFLKAHKKKGDTTEKTTQADRQKKL